MKISKNKISKMQREIDAVLEKYGAISKNNARFNDTSVSFNVEVVFETNEDPSDIKWYNGSTIDIRSGFATPGTKVIFGRDKLECKIIKPRRTKYLFEFLQGPDKGKQFIANFNAFSANKTVEK